MVIRTIQGILHIGRSTELLEPVGTVEATYCSGGVGIQKGLCIGCSMYGSPPEDAECIGDGGPCEMGGRPKIYRLRAGSA